MFQTSCPARAQSARHHLSPPGTSGQVCQWESHLAAAPPWSTKHGPCLINLLRRCAPHTSTYIPWIQHLSWHAPPPPSSVEMVSQTLREACGTVCNEDPIPGERSPHSETQIDPQVYASHREAMRHQSAASETATRTFKCSVNYMLCRNYFFL